MPKPEQQEDDVRVVRAKRCAVCKVVVETDIPPLNACSEHKAEVAKANKVRGEKLRAGGNES